MASLVLDTRQLEPFEIAAELHVRLAYPKATPKRYADLVRSACADQVAVFIEEEPKRKAEILARFPKYDPRENRIQRKYIIDRLEDAQRMGVVVLALIKGTADYRPPSLDFAVGRTLQLSEPTTAREQNRYEHRIHDIIAREIRPRYPVAHLAAALAFLARKQDDDGLDMQFSYLDLNFMRRWILKAREIEGFIRATPMRENIASKLIDIEWIE